jgi:hypothetical protein
LGWSEAHISYRTYFAGDNRGRYSPERGWKEIHSSRMDVIAFPLPPAGDGSAECTVCKDETRRDILPIIEGEGSTGETGHPKQTGVPAAMCRAWLSYDSRHTKIPPTFACVLGGCGSSSRDYQRPPMALTPEPRARGVMLQHDLVITYLLTAKQGGSQ